MASSKAALVRIGLNALARDMGLGFAPTSGGAASGSITGSPVAQLPSRLWAALERNVAAEQDRWFPWSVAGFVTGIGVYFALLWEPSIGLACAVFCAGLFAAVVGTRSAATMLRFACALGTAACFGFAAAKLRTETIIAPIIAHDTGPLTIEGRVETVLAEDLTHARIVLAPTRFPREKLALPASVRLTLRGAKAVAAVAPGKSVSLLAVLRPPPEPAEPGGYDFARTAFFSGLGATGYVMGAPKPLDTASKMTLWEEASAAVERLRLSMTARIEAALPGPEGAISAALITGERAAISDDDNAAYRDSGLFHVLSISGVHMALAGLGIFWIVRALLALFPRAALTQPIKKWAAIAALVAATFYLFISGAGAPAVRSYIMLAAMLVGVLADRPLLSMRAVAISALIILAVQPEGVIDPSFQMSFAAIIGLIALAEWQRKLTRDGAVLSGAGRALRWVKRYMVGLILASVVAGLATAPFAIYHFDRAPGYSLLANLLATPVVGLVIMPAACLAVAAMPLHLEYWPAQAMGWGVARMTDIAHWVASLPGAVNLLPAWSGTVLVLIASGGLWLGLWQRRWRWLGLAPIAAGLVLAFTDSPPDVLIARDAAGAAVRGTDGHLILIGKPDDYTAAQWLLRDGDERAIDAAHDGAACDERGCVASDAGGRKTALALRPGALADDCLRANLLISTIPLRQPCAHPARVIDRFDVLHEGAMALWFSADGVRSVSVAQMRGRRPWTTRSGAPAD